MASAREPAGGAGNGAHGEAAERAYREIRRRIGSGEYGPGDRLTETLLRDVLRMSRTPIRDALVRLDAEGHVRLTPKRGAVVAESTVDLAELLSLRASLEAPSARIAATRGRQDEIARLRTLGGEMEDALSDDAECARLNREFHVLIATMTRLRRFESLVASLYDVPVLDAAARLLTSEDRGLTIAQHAEIVVALERRDAEWVEAAVRAHIRSTRRLLLTRVRET